MTTYRHGKTESRIAVAIAAIAVPFLVLKAAAVGAWQEGKLEAKCCWAEMKDAWQNGFRRP